MHWKWQIWFNSDTQISAWTNIRQGNTVNAHEYLAKMEWYGQKFRGMFFLLPRVLSVAFFLFDAITKFDIALS